VGVPTREGGQSVGMLRKRKRENDSEPKLVNAAPRNRGLNGGKVEEKKTKTTDRKRIEVTVGGAKRCFREKSRMLERRLLVESREKAESPILT